MPYYKVKARLIPIEGETAPTVAAPDVDCRYRVIRPHRVHDDCFIIETEKPLKSFVEEVHPDDPVVRSRVAWWGRCAADAKEQKRMRDNAEISGVKTVGKHI